MDDDDLGIPIDMAEPFFERDERGRERESTPPVRRIVTIAAAELAGRDVPPRQFHVPSIIPARTVTLLSGDGGTGKSLLALQLAVATAAGERWLGLEVQAGPVLYLSAEDELDELHRRLADICAETGLRFQDLESLHLAPLAGEDAVLAAPGKASMLSPTSLWRATEVKTAECRPKLIVMDTQADLFGGDENNRVHARQFVGMLRGLAIRNDATVLMLSHPSQSGITSGSGSSGSLGWGNSVRSRLYLRRVTLKEDDGRTDYEPDPDARVLVTKKANYGPTGAETRLRWVGGVFRAEPGQSLGIIGEATRIAREDAVFLELVERYQRERRPVSVTPSANYAPTIFARDTGSKGLGKAALSQAMNRLLEEGRIAVEEFGPPSRRGKRIVLAAA